MDITQKFWSFCHKLRHDGIDSSDYIEQLTYLLFLKMADEKHLNVPENYGWKQLISKNNEELIKHLDETLQALKNEKGILGQIFAEPVSRIKNTVILKDLLKEIDSIQWTKLDSDVVGIAFEELIGRVANEGKKGAGQYFTPRPLIKTMINVMQPQPFANKDYKMADVACGTAGFLTLACEWVHQNFPKETIEQAEKLKYHTFWGQELVQRPRRLALMNMFLHGVDTSETIKFGDTIENDQLPNDFDLILANPPFGNKGASPLNRKFPVKTSDKQLNFVQLIIEKLKKGGKAAVVLPDSCLSSQNAKKIWAYYLDKEKSGKNVCNLHTILKLPEGIFASYANGVKACVVFLEKGKETKKMWIYDARKNTEKVTTRSNPLTEEHFANFEVCFQNRKETEKFRLYQFAEIQEKEFDLSFTTIWQPNPTENPIDLINQMILDYQNKISFLEEMKKDLLKFQKKGTNNEHSETLANNETSKSNNNSKREKATSVKKHAVS